MWVLRNSLPNTSFSEPYLGAYPSLRLFCLGQAPLPDPCDQEDPSARFRDWAEAPTTGHCQTATLQPGVFRAFSGRFRFFSSADMSEYRDVYQRAYCR